MRGDSHEPVTRNRTVRRVSQGGLAATVCLSALALGGAHVNVVLAGTLVVAICGALALASESLRRVPGGALLFAGLSIFSLVQSVPVPLSALRILSPYAADIWEGSLVPFGEKAVFGSFSLDPGASSVEAAKWAAYAVAFAMAAAFGRRRGATPVVQLIFASALLLALATVAHGAMGATRVFGLYEAQFAHPGWRLGPMLNPNCLAGYLVLGVSCALGLIASRTAPRLNWFYLCGIALMSALIAVSSSRGAFAALIASVAAFVVLFGRSRFGNRRSIELSWLSWAGLAAAVLLAPAAVLLVVPDAWVLLVQNDLEKVRMWCWIVPMVRHFPLFGVGRGAFESAFAAYKPVANDMLYTHPENIVAQWLCEWGLLAGTVGLGTALWLFRPSRFQVNRHMSALGALIGVAALVLQNFVDLGLELFAPMLAVTVLLGSCSGQTPSDPIRSKPQNLGASRWSPPALISLLVISATLAFVRGRSPVAIARLGVEAAYAKISMPGTSRATLSELWSDLHSAIQQHPAEPYFPRIGALLAKRSKKPVMPWIDSSLERCPVDSRTHWILATTLQQHGFLSQALLEARLTAEYDPNLAPTVGSAVASWSQTLPDLERVAPPGWVGGRVLYHAALAFKDPKLTELRVALFRAAVRHDPDSSILQLALAGNVIATFRTHCIGEDVKRCEADILGAAAALDRVSPESSNGSEVRASFYALTGRLEEADRVLSARCPELEEPAQAKCWGALLSAAPRRPENRALIDRVVRRSVKNACLVDEGCDAVLIRAGDAMAELGEWLDALAYFERAAARAPSVPVFLKVADVAQLLGRVRIAERALDLAAGRASNDPAVARLVEAKRRSLLQEINK